MLIFILTVLLFLTPTYAIDLDNLPVNEVVNPYATVTSFYPNTQNDFTKFYSNYVGGDLSAKYVYFPQNNEYSTLVYSAPDDYGLQQSRVEIYDSNYNLITYMNFSDLDEYNGFTGVWYYVDMSAYSTAVFVRYVILGTGTSFAEVQNNKDALTDLWSTEAYSMYYWLSNMNEDMQQYYDEGYFQGQQDYINEIEPQRLLDEYNRGYNSGFEFADKGGFWSWLPVSIGAILGFALTIFTYEIPLVGLSALTVFSFLAFITVLLLIIKAIRG